MGRFFRRGGWLLKKGGGVLKKPVEVLKEFDPLPSTLSVSPYNWGTEKTQYVSTSTWIEHATPHRSHCA